MFDVVALGELLIDFTPAGKSRNGNPLFEQNPGGAPANLLVQVTRLGGRCAFIGKVGNDQFGHFLADTLKAEGIDTTGLLLSDEYNTTLDFVHLFPSGDRTFSFYRKKGGGADLRLTKDEVPYSLIDQGKIFHFGAVAMTDDPARSTTLAAAEYAKKQGKLVSYDPNWRPPLWESDETAARVMKMGLQYCDILKVSDGELFMLTGETDAKKGASLLRNMGIPLVFVTMGEKGCYFSCNGGEGFSAAYDVKVADTTGCGDAFTGSILHIISSRNIDVRHVSKDEMAAYCDFANAAGSLCAAGTGAIPSMGRVEDIENLRKNGKKLG